MQFLFLGIIGCGALGALMAAVELVKQSKRGNAPVHDGPDAEPVMGFDDDGANHGEADQLDRKRHGNIPKI